MTLTTQQIDEAVEWFDNLTRGKTIYDGHPIQVIDKALQLAKENVWQDMETAPKNKPIIILSSLGDMYVGQWVQHPATGHEAYLVASGFDDEGNQILVENPVKWRNIEPPKTEE